MSERYQHVVQRRIGGYLSARRPLLSLMLSSADALRAASESSAAVESSDEEEEAEEGVDD